MLDAFSQDEKNGFFGQHEYRRIAEKIDDDTSRIRFNLADFLNLDRVRSLQCHWNTALSVNNGLFPAQSSLFLRKGGDAIGEEEVRNFLSRSGHEPLTELRNFATNLRLRAIAKVGAFGDIGERDRCIALGETGDAALPLADNRVALWRIEIL